MDNVLLERENYIGDATEVLKKKLTNIRDGRPNLTILDSVRLSTLRSVLTEQREEVFTEKPIVSLKNISQVEDEVYKITEKLQKFIKEYHKELRFDFYVNSVKGCYFLSTLFALVSDWNLVQGQMKARCGEAVYHSWLKKGDIVYDPEFRIITTNDKYELFFQEEEVYSKSEVETYLKRTGIFTYYKKDLEDGTIFPEAYLILYDTEKANEYGSRILQNLQTFYHEQEKEKINIKQKKS